MSSLSYHHIAIEECGEPLLKVSSNEFVIEPVYFKNGWSLLQNVYARQTVLEKLRRIQDGFGGNYRFLIWDAWRSRQVQQNIFDYYNHEIRSQNTGKNEEELIKLVATFVSSASDMNRVPPHSTGGAIDLTLLDKEGHPLDMGTGFDDLTSKARTNYFSTDFIDSKIDGNRRRLLEAMASEGFVNYPDEWWHFDYGTQLGMHGAKLRGPAIYGEVSYDFRFLHAPDRSTALG